jgi:hypothetical protein
VSRLYLRETPSAVRDQSTAGIRRHVASIGHRGWGWGGKGLNQALVAFGAYDHACCYVKDLSRMPFMLFPR